FVVHSLPTTPSYPLSLHDALPISRRPTKFAGRQARSVGCRSEQARRPGNSARCSPEKSRPPGKLARRRTSEAGAPGDSGGARAYLPGGWTNFVHPAAGTVREAIGRAGVCSGPHMGPPPPHEGGLMGDICTGQPLRQVEPVWVFVSMHATRSGPSGFSALHLSEPAFVCSEQTLEQSDQLEP